MLNKFSNALTAGVVHQQADLQTPAASTQVFAPEQQSA